MLLGSVNAAAPERAVRTAAGTWETLNLTSGGGLGFDASGNAIAVWRQYDGTRLQVWTNRYLAASGWGTAAQINTGSGTGSSAGAAHVMVRPNGNAKAWWTETGDVVTSNFTPTGGWGSPTTVSIAPARNINFWPSTAIANTAGDTTLVWDDYVRTDGYINVSTGQYTVWTKQVNNDGTVSLTQALAPPVYMFKSINTTNSHSGAMGPRFGIDAQGNAMAIWVDNGSSINDSDARPIQTARRVAGVWQSVQPLPVEGARRINDYDLAVAANGDAMMVFNGTTTTVNLDSRSVVWSGVSALRYVTGQGWDKSPVLIQNTKTYTTAPKLLADGAGNMLAVWAEPGTGVWANRYVAGSGWGTPTAVRALTTYHEYDPYVAVNTKGDAVVVWRQTDTSRKQSIWASTFAADTGWRSPTQLQAEGPPDSSLSPAKSNSQLRAAVDANGNATVIWDWHDGTRYNMWTATFRR